MDEGLILNDERFAEFVRHFPFEQGAVGHRPHNWACTMGLFQDEVRARQANLYNLPVGCLTRAQVRQICRNPATHPLFGYVSVMAWGGAGVGVLMPHALAALRSFAEIEPRLTSLRDKTLSREAAYGLFANGQIPGLGPAFFTKLLFFYSPNESVETNMYIMDQWTARSINLLYEPNVVQVVCSQTAKGRQCAVANFNTEENYAKFCRAIEGLAERIAESIPQRCEGLPRETPGARVEEALFSVGGHHPGPWRQYVRDHG